jgi:hypothetical protein
MILSESVKQFGYRKEKIDPSLDLFEEIAKLKKEQLIRQMDFIVQINAKENIQQNRQTKNGLTAM